MFCNTQKQKIVQLESLLNEKNTVLKALDRVSAVIEFDLDGTILKANDNFLKTMGYSLADIQGQHHRIFVEPELAQSSDYQQFWQRLRQGEFISNRFKRINRNGEVVWLEASYNPLLDSKGNVCKIIKFATDITEQVNKDFDAQAQIEAIYKVMAVIEFDPTGKILQANDNFLKAMGYSLAEIKDKHHKMFALQEVAESAEYVKFWKDLALGKSFSGTYHRLGKGGDDVWLEASYNPIFDANGKVVKVIKYATDISSNSNAILLNRVIDEATKTILGLAHGDLNQKMECLVDESSRGMYDDEIRSLTLSVQEMTEKLKEVITKVVHASNASKASASEISLRAESLNSRVHQQSEELKRTSSTMDDMNKAIQETSSHVQQANHVASDVELKANKGVEVMKQTIDAMTKIQESSEKISDIVALIDGIAFQTNLLALNAAVEAARAGEQGRGFAVVAGEVRSLAQKSAEAAKDIKQLIDETVSRVNQGSTMASESGDMLSSIHLSIGEVTQMISQIAGASKYQAQGISDVHTAIKELDRVTHENAGLVSETLGSAEKLDAQADVLSQDMTYFKL